MYRFSHICIVWIFQQHLGSPGASNNRGHGRQDTQERERQQRRFIRRGNELHQHQQTTDKNDDDNDDNNDELIPRRTGVTQQQVHRDLNESDDINLSDIDVSIEPRHRRGRYIHDAKKDELQRIGDTDEDVEEDTLEAAAATAKDVANNLSPESNDDSKEEEDTYYYDDAAGNGM